MSANSFLSSEKAEGSTVGMGLGLGVAILMAIFIFATIQGPMEDQITSLNNTNAQTATSTVTSFVWVFITLAGISIIVLGAIVVMQLVNRM